MGQIQKATGAAIALAITLVGATFVTAPLTLPDSQHVVAHAHQWSATRLHHIAADLQHAASSTRA